MDYKLYAIVDEDNLVVNCTTWDLEHKIQNLLDSTYSPRYRAIEYSEDNSITNNQGFIGGYYDLELNAFVPRKPGDNYTLNTETYQWVFNNP